MSVRGPNNVGRAVQTDRTLLHYASASRNKRNVGSCWFKSCCVLLGVVAQSLKPVQLCAKGANNVGSCYVRLHVA